MVGEILNAYAMISRSRQYAGMAGVPLPLSPHDVERYLASCDTQIERDEFMATIMALDDAWREGWARAQNNHDKVKK